MEILDELSELHLLDELFVIYKSQRVVTKSHGVVSAFVVTRDGKIVAVKENVGDLSGKLDQEIEQE